MRRTLLSQRRVPDLFKKTASLSLIFPSLFLSLYLCTALSAGSPTGTIRCFEPLPRTFATPLIKSISSVSRPTSSLTLIPVEYNISRIALSRRPANVSPGGHSTSFATFFSSSTTGNLLSSFGVNIALIGFVFI